MSTRSAALLRAVLVVFVSGGAFAALAAPHPSAPPLAHEAPLDRRPGPIPDYAPISAVWTHQQLAETAPSMIRALDHLLGPRHRVEAFTPLDWEQAEEAREQVGGALASVEVDNAMLWMRDYQPLFVRRPDGLMEGVRYLHPNLNRATYRLDDRADPWPGRARYRALPLVHEQGNLVVAGRWVFVSDLIYADNSAGFPTPHLRRAGYVARTPEQVVAHLARAIYRPPSDIVVLPRMPGEETGHIDLWLMPLDDQTVMVPAIEAAIARRSDPAIDTGLADAVARFLDARASQMQALGLRVVRVPMLPPLVLPAKDDDSEGPSWDTIFYSPANGLLANTGQRRWALMPSIDLSELAPALALTQRRYEARWIAALGAQGWTVRMVDATALGRYLGLLRCVTQAVPQP